MPDGLRDLAADAAVQGVRNMSILMDRWVDGSERFDRVGESLLIAETEAGAVVGVGGLSHCPHVPGALRVRRFYVATDWRRKGVARTLAKRLVDDGFRHSDTLTCNARASTAAAPFWEAMGFRPVDIDGVTHVRSDR